MRPHIRAMVKYLREAGAAQVAVDEQHPHPRLYYTWNGQRQFYVVPRSPHSASSYKNDLARVKRILSGVEPHAAQR